MKAEKTNNHINGVKCAVNSCYYHADGNYCNASNIEIQQKNATDSQETDCATFVSSNMK